MHPLPTVIESDCLDAMRAMEPDSIEAIVTDPPYGLAFMGKEWDHGVPGAPFWAEALRVAKPGAHLVAFGGSRTYHRLACAVEEAGWEIRDQITWLYGGGMPKGKNLAGAYAGLGTGLKPAHEPIVLARKPLIGTVEENILAHGTGALDLDGCRVEGNRWPANVALDEAAAAMLDAHTGALKSGTMKAGTRRAAQDGPGSVCFGTYGGNATSADTQGDTGGASRFFYCAKASRSERDHGLGEGPRKPLNWSSGEQSPGTFQSEGTDRTARNHHPTVKPISLMRWLCRLITPPGGTILDPFAGSGSTLIAAYEEGFTAIGVEKFTEYCEIARQRVARIEPRIF